MKKSIKSVITVFALCTAMALAFTACGGSDDAPQGEETTVASAAAEETTEASEEEIAADTDNAEAEAEPVEADETEAETKAESETASVDNSGKTVFKGDGYTVAIDENVWTDYTELTDEVTEYVGEDSEYSADDYKEVSNGIFLYAADPSVNINIVSSEVIIDDFNADLVGAAMKIEYDKLEGYNFEAYEGVEINGKEWCRVDVSADEAVFGVKAHFKQYVTNVNKVQYVVTVTAMGDSAGKADADVKEFLSAITFTEE